MEKFVGLIIFLAIFIIGKILENAQKKQAVHKKKPEPVIDRTNYTKEEIKSDSTYNRPDEATAKTAEYHASEDEIEDFLRSIGVLKKEDEKIVNKIEHPIPSVPSDSVAKEKIKTTLHPCSNPVKKAEKSIGTNSIEVENEYKQVETAGRLDLSLLNDKENLKTVFILNEILRPPLAFRRFNSR